MITLRLLSIPCLLFTATLISLHADTIALDPTTDTGGNGWMAILAPGAAPVPCCGSNPIAGDSRISGFEAANPGWNSNPSFDTTGWQPYTGGWIDGAGDSPFFGRDVINIPGTVNSATFTMQVDDDSIVWVNGVLVPGLDDESGALSAPLTADIAPYLVTGDNVIAFVAHNSFGGGFGLYEAHGSIDFTPTPEPQSLALAGLGMLTLFMVARRRNA